MKTYNRIMEVFWLAAAVFSVIAVGYLIKNIGFAEGGLWLALPVIALFMWYMRRRFRKRMQQQQDQQKGPK